MIHFFRTFLFLLLFTLPLIAEEKKTVCLNMIVKNEKHVISRCLESVRPLIDYWVIVDTGSTDGTQEEIREYFKDVPGELHERPWKNFEHNRNEALALAKDKADYILIIDADDSLKIDPNFQMPSLTYDSYQLWVAHGGTSYCRTHLIKASLPWQWVGVLHEVLMCHQARSSEVLQGVTYFFGGDGARSKDPKKYLKDAQVLEEALKEDPKNSRYMFYLAQSYRDYGDYEQTIKWYQNRVDMGGWPEEVYWSMLQIAEAQAKLGYPLDTVIDSFQRAHRYRPHRIETIYYLAEIYNRQKRYDLAYATIKYRNFIPMPKEKDILFNQDWMEEYGLLFQLSVCAFYVGKYKESLEACDTLLKQPHLPTYWKNLVETNRKYPLEKLHPSLIPPVQPLTAKMQ